MVMTDKELKDLRSFSAFMLTEFGFQISPNDPVLPALYVIHKEMQLNNQKNESIASLIQGALSRINPKEFHFHTGEAASKFQRGITFRWGIVGLLLVSIAWASAWFWSMRKELEKAQTIIGVAGNMEELFRAAKRDKDGAFFIEFTASKGDSTRHFTEYRKINAKTVRVYLGRESR
jgi:hypothetical protein